MSASLARISPRKAKPPRYPYSAELTYAKALIRLVGEIRRIALEEVRLYGPEIIRQADIDFHRADAISTPFGWSALLNSIIERIAFGITSALLAALNKAGEIGILTADLHKRDFTRQISQAYGGANRMAANPLAVNVLSNEPGLPSLLSAWEQNNLALIKSIPDGVVGQLRSEFTQAFVNGTNLKDLTQIVQDRTGVGKSRAQLIARDQVGKLNGQLSAMRQKAAGINTYRWRTVGDERVRPKHRVRNNKTYSWDDGEIKPGQEIRCRCVADPIFPDFS